MTGTVIPSTTLQLSSTTTITSTSTIPISEPTMNSSLTTTDIHRQNETTTVTSSMILNTELTPTLTIFTDVLDMSLPTVECPIIRRLNTFINRERVQSFTTIVSGQSITS